MSDEHVQQENKAICNCCNEELEHFLERPSKKPKLKKEGKTLD
jgi:hypothetical protein